MTQFSAGSANGPVVLDIPTTWHVITSPMVGAGWVWRGQCQFDTTWTGKAVPFVRYYAKREKQFKLTMAIHCADCERAEMVITSKPSVTIHSGLVEQWFNPISIKAKWPTIEWTLKTKGLPLMNPVCLGFYVYNNPIGSGDLR